MADVSLQLTNLTTGAITYQTQTGISSTGTPIYTNCDQYGQTICSGQLITNADGTKSCVVQIGVTTTGQPIYQVDTSKFH